ncbi:MAG: helix-turn-helix domain-containing protein [Pyrinomonadaceae bacterium]
MSVPRKKARIAAEETGASHEFSEIPKDAREREEFERQYMTPKELADRWKVSESAIHHRKANSNKVPRYRFGRAIRFIRQEIYDFEKTLPAQ